MNRIILIAFLSIFLYNCQVGNTNTASAVQLNNNNLMDFSLSKPVRQFNPNSPWMTLKKEVSITAKENKRIAQSRNNYLKNKYYFEQMLSNSEPYIYYIIAELHKRNMPTELAVLPLIESNYELNSKSYSNAAGLWQIVPITAKGLNLERSKWYDARYDFTASTDAALDLLQYLNKRFDGDWLLTIAAYNAGEGRIKKAIAKNKKLGKPTDFWSLPLSKETSQYIPKFLSIVDIIRNDRKYDVQLPILSPDNQLVKVEINKPISLEKLAQYTQLEDDVFLDHNAAYLQKQLNSPSYVFIPKSYALDFRNELAKHNLLKKPPMVNEYKNEQLALNNQKRETELNLSAVNSANPAPGVLKIQQDSHEYKLKPGNSLLSISPLKDASEKNVMELEENPEINQHQVISNPSVFPDRS